MKNNFSERDIFWNHVNSGEGLEDNLKDIYGRTKNVLGDAIQDLLMRLQFSFENNQERIEESADNLYFDLKNYIKSIFISTDKKTNCVFLNYNLKNKSKGKHVCAEDAQIVCEELKEDKKDEDNNYNCNNYISLVNRVISSSEGIINNVATVLAGKLCNSYGIKDRKPKRLWKWQDRMDYLEFYLKDNVLSADEKEQLKELRYSLQKNRYLKFKRKDYFKRMDECLANYQ